MLYRPRSQSHPSETGSFSTDIVRNNVPYRTSAYCWQPTEHCVQVVWVRLRSQGRDLKRYVFEVSAPTGQSSVTFPVKLWRYGRPVAVAMMSRAPRSFTTSCASPAMMSSKRTHR